MDTRYSPIRRSSTRKASFPLVTPRLACVKPVASVHPEPGSNSPLYIMSFCFFPLQDVRISLKHSIFNPYTHNKSRAELTFVFFFPHLLPCPKTGRNGFLYYSVCLCNLFKDRLSCAPLFGSGCKGTAFFHNAKLFMVFFQFYRNFFRFSSHSLLTVTIPTLLYIKARNK